MNIGMILRGKYPPDIRVEKEVRSLIVQGYKVFLLCYKKRNQSEEEIVENLKVHRIEPPWEKLLLPARKLNSFKFHLVFQNDYWAKKLSNFVKDYSLDVLHVHNLPLLGTAIRAGRDFDIPVIADLHENYPAALEILTGDEINFLDRFYKNPKRWSLYERRALAEADKIIVVVEEAKKRLLRDYNTPSEKITILMNVVDTEYFSGLKLFPDILNRYKETFLTLYIGGGGKHRGLKTTLHSLQYLRDEIPNIKLLLIGPRGSELDSLLKIRAEEKIQEKVDLIGWQEFKNVPSYIQASDVCLVPHLKNYHTDTTIPHKLFQYMFQKKPVLVSDCKPLKRIVEETKSGLVFKSGDPKDLACKIIKLYRDKELRLLHGSKGYNAVINRYNWKKESKKLISLYKSLT